MQFDFHIEEMVSTKCILLHGLTGAVLIALVLFLTNPYFSILEDETSIVVAANSPISHTLELFVTGEGQHEHPPLSDLFLHFWLPVAGVSPSLVRLPSIVFYSLALVTLAGAAQKMAGAMAFYATMLFGMLWPFGFHFGRLAGWYSFCFLLLGLLTLSYLYFLEDPNWKRWSLVLCVSFAAVSSNYFCWFFIAVIILDLLLTFERRAAFRYAAVSLAVLFIGYGPLWISLAHEVHGVDPTSVGRGIQGTVINAGFNLYALFISESVAPWFWTISIPGVIATGIVLVTTLFLIEGRARRFYFGFIGLFGIMAALGIIGTKRLLFISGWLLIGIGCALAGPTRPRLRVLLGMSLLVTVVIGWTGILSRKYYGSLHYVEPWAALAREAAENVGKGQAVISNSPSFLFYLNASLHDLGLSANEKPGWANGPNVISLIESDMPERVPAKQIMFVRGVNTSATQRTARAEQWMISHCRLHSSDQLLRDGGFELKKRYFHIDVDDPYRIRIEQFDCRH
jgi:hypothetical protein